jgi:hypothetical protein
MQATSQMHEDKFVFRNSNIYDMIQKWYIAYLNLLFL